MISINEYNPAWNRKFQQEAIRIHEHLGEDCLNIFHIGSTSVPGLVAKPIIDILVVVRDFNRFDSAMNCLQNLDYIAMGEYGILGRRFFWKSPEKRNFHLHVFENGNIEITRHIAFRDYLCIHHHVAKAYGAIKQALAKQFPHDREGYALGKDSFVRAVHYWAGVAKKDQLEAKDHVNLELYNPRWVKWANAEIQAIKNIIAHPYHSIHHLGSTAILNMKAKPTIDLYIGLNNMQSAQDWITPLENLGYTYWRENPNKNHAWYFKGMPPFGIARTHHVHIMPSGEKLNRYIQFNKQLQNSEDLRNDYIQLKNDLASKYAYDRERYTHEKSAFIAKALDN